MCVSIPDRYAKNLVSFFVAVAFLGGFQFLIGTLKTKFLSDFTAEVELFQFLIGTLKTPFILSPVSIPAAFQFLIGTLKTTINCDTNDCVYSFNS